MFVIKDNKGNELEIRTSGRYYPGQALKINNNIYHIVSILTFRDSEQVEIYCKK